ncbi:hypothetical protein FHS82_001070 [Pseudochelatococcus lubricantis]|uniref:KilA-N domain-containing protein n=1 Tax=Pseudochelatococcus lubricantis TaxID=1538102 RepID=A0ABX0UWB2_9HYPH|nr:KilA-N domain-containing protein [Pseudochelatococcus lubricantis]NIJ57244.1 hypothetical protein [Pseudochelatococcus lubricantis]
MSTGTYSTSALVYNGEVINARDEMLSLTDMWKAAGGDKAKQPANWLASAEAQRFIQFLDDVLNPRNSGIELVKAVRGGKSPGTWAHWQIGLAYAKYLSPEFHAKCNVIVRERMEGKSISVASLPPEVLEMIRRDDGISRMLAHKVTGIERTVEALTSVIAAIAQVVQPSTPVLIRQGRTAGQILKSAGYPPMRGLAPWFGGLLTKVGCRVPDNARAEIGTARARLFDPDKAEAYLENGGRVAVDAKIAERRGQMSLHLVRGGRTDEDRPSIQ